MADGEDRAPRTVADGLAAVVALRRLADLIEAAQVDRALSEGWSWTEIAEALGVTRQAVHKKHARRVAAGGRGRRPGAAAAAGAPLGDDGDDGPDEEAS